MPYQIFDKLLPVGMNRPGEPLYPVGIVIHETATPGATDEREVQYFSTHKCDASAHYFVDYDSITRAIPENEVAWHCGPKGNRLFIGIEMCHFDDSVQFEETWKRTVWLAADICKRHGWNPDECIHSHNWVSRTYRETDHTDPYEYFAKFGKDMDMFIADVKREMQKGGQPMQEVPQWKKDAVDWAVKNKFLSQYHDPLETIDMGTLCAVIKNLVEKGGK